MTGVPNPLNIRNIRLIAGGPGGERARAMFGKQALQMLKQGHLANAPLPQWRMRRFVSDERGNLIVINIKSNFGLDTIEFLAPPELVEPRREEKTEHRKRTDVPGARREYFPAIRVWDSNGEQVGFIISRESDKWGPPWDLLELAHTEDGTRRQTELEAGLIDWREGQWSRPDSPYEGRSQGYPEPFPRWAFPIDISIPGVKDELWLWRDVDPDSEEMFLEIDYEKIDPVYLNTPPLPNQQWDWAGSYYYHYHAPVGTHVWVSGLKPAVWNYGSFIKTGFALHSDTQIFRELSAINSTSVQGICCNFQWFTLEEVWSEDLARDDDWERVHDPLEGHPEWAQRVPDHQNIGWWFQVGSFAYRVGTTASFEATYTLQGPNMYFLDFYGTWSGRGYAVFQCHTHTHSVIQGLREFYPDDINNFPWDSISIHKDNPCLQVYPHTCGWWGLAAALDAENTTLISTYSWEEFFEINGVMHPIKSGSLTPPSEYATRPGIRAQNTHPRYFRVSDKRTCAILGLRRDQFHTFEYYYYNTDEEAGRFESDSTEFPGWVFVPAGGDESQIMHLVNQEVYKFGELYGPNLYANGTTRLFEKIVLDRVFEEEVIKFDGSGVPQYSTTPERA